MSASPILCITNDFGPRAGGIETFIIGLIQDDGTLKPRQMLTGARDVSAFTALIDPLVAELAERHTGQP